MMHQTALTLRALAHLLRYPDAEMRRHLIDIHATLNAEPLISAAYRDVLNTLMDRLLAEGMDAEATYVDLFDRGRGTALHLFEHVHGDSRDRGPAMIDLVRTYEQAGLLLDPTELPDHLTVLLEYASTQPTQEARAFIGEFAHILRAILGTLQKRNSDYASVIAAILDVSGESTQPVVTQDEDPLDASWSEPPVFGDCNTQAAPNTPKPVHILRRSPGPAA